MQCVPSRTDKHGKTTCYDTIPIFQRLTVNAKIIEDLWDVCAYLLLIEHVGIHPSIHLVCSSIAKWYETHPKVTDSTMVHVEKMVATSSGLNEAANW